MFFKASAGFSAPGLWSFTRPLAKLFEGVRLSIRPPHRRGRTIGPIFAISKDSAGIPRPEAATEAWSRRRHAAGEVLSATAKRIPKVERRWP
jgi:hypothetical protein